MLAETTITYLGTAGWQIKTPHISVLFDPYFTRMSMPEMLFARRGTDADLVKCWCPEGDAVFISHGHYDHILDGPEAAEITGAKVYASAQSRELLCLNGLASERVSEINPGDVIQIDEVEVEAYAAKHRKMLGVVPVKGPLRPDLGPPLNARTEYKMDILFSFRVITPACRVLILNGIDHEPAYEAEVLIVGADVTRQKLKRIIETVRPLVILPNHWDDMFLPLSKPVRPQRLMSFPLMRMSLERFRERAEALAPKAKVIIPERFRPLTFSKEQGDA